MRWVLLSGVIWAGVAAAAGTPRSYTFGGFSPGGREYLKRGPQDLVCAPEPAPACRVVDRKDTRGFVKPPRGRKAGGVTLGVSIEDDTRVVLAGGERTLAEHTPGGRVTAVNSNLFVSADGDLVAVEFEVEDDGRKRSDVAVFDLRAPATPSSAAPSAKAAPVARGGNAYDRALGKGGVWEQRIIPCDQAGVTLKLAKTRKFAIKILTRCQGRKDVTDLAGSWATEGDDTVVLSFQNEDGPLESMVCRFAQCPDDPEDCLTCTQEDVSFTMQVVRR